MFIELPEYVTETVRVAKDYRDYEIACEKNEKVKRTVENYEVLTGDEEVKRLSEIRMMSNLEEKSALNCAREEGKKQGEEIGLKRGKKEIAKKLKEKKCQ